MAGKNSIDSRMLRAATLALLCYSGLVLTTPVAAQQLSVGISDNLTAPLVVRHGDQISAGILKELCDELGQRLNLKIEYLPLPRKRHLMGLESGQIHLQPYANPGWLHTSSELSWSPPWMVDRELFVLSIEQHFHITEFDDLNNKRLGTIHGYRYPGLELWLEQRWIIRADSHTLEQNFKRLEAGRIDVLIDKQLMIQHHLKRHHAPERFQVAPLIVSENPIQMALSPHLPVPAESLNNALQQMIDEGLIEELLTKYR